MRTIYAEVKSMEWMYIGLTLFGLFVYPLIYGSFSPHCPMKATEMGSGRNGVKIRGVWDIYRERKTDFWDFNGISGKLEAVIQSVTFCRYFTKNSNLLWNSLS